MVALLRLVRVDRVVAERAEIGFALALAYFRVAPLPRNLVEIPLEYFRKAVDWMKARPTANTRRIAVMGISRGAECVAVGRPLTWKSSARFWRSVLT